MMQRNETSVRKAVPADAEKISVLEKENFSSPWSFSQIKEETERDDSVFLVSEKNGELTGYVSGRNILGEFYISDIAVEKSSRREKTGTRLLSALLAECRKTGCVFATLEVRESNLPARALYESLGFVNQGIRKNFYSMPAENACIYTLYF